ncbi:MAG TPA: HupE/UreJ family protein [Burkholderiales bacterium]|nr:HupE/UreJ family protein [Burkholderiales bacterium]
MRAGAILFLAAVFLAGAARAHDIPDEVRVQAFLKPEGRALFLLARVPLKAMRDVDVPRRSGGFLDFERVDSALREAATLWLGDEIELYEDGVRLGQPRVLEARVALESDRSFASYEQALASFSAPRLRNDTELFWTQGLLDVLLEYPIRSDRSEFSIRPRLERLGIRVNTVLRFIPPQGEVRAFDLHGDPGLVRLDPRWYQAAFSFVGSGFMHILEGPDHLLFLLLLVVPFRRFLPLAAIVTAFTVAHSITLIATALGHGPDALWFPPLIETLIAASILYMAFENVLGPGLRRRWILAFAFGLVHGFGFAFGLQQLLQFAGAHMVTSLVAFNLGVELGQLLVLAVLIPALNLLFRYVKESVGTLLLSLLAGHTAWHWLIERGERLAKFPWPAFDPGALAGAIRWLMALLVVGGLAWVASDAIQRSRKRKPR